MSVVNVKVQHIRPKYNNLKEWMHEFKEWDEAPKEGKLIGEKKKDHENDTIH